MEELFIKVITGLPLQDHREDQIQAAQYTILTAQAPCPKDRIKLLQSRLQTSTETSSAQNASYLLNTCIVADLVPDDAEEMVENLTQIAQQHPNWHEFVRWVCALIHYYCTDDVTLSIFSEFEVPQVAVRSLHDFPQNRPLVLAACVLLSHFNFYNIGDGITQLSNILKIYSADLLIAKSASRAIAEFTSYSKDIPQRFAESNSEFVDADGMAAVEVVLRDHLEDEEITTYAARIAANVTSSGHASTVDPDSPLMMYFADALARYPQSELLCSHVLRVFSNLPRSQYIDWEKFSSLFSTTSYELVALECIHFLSGVAINMKEMKHKIYSTGCVPRVLDAMRKHESNASIQEEACSLLSYLSFDSEAITASITESGGLLLVLNAMRKYPENEDLQMAACAALSGLTFNNQAGQQVIVDNKGVALIVDAMRRGKKARLQENGCLAIGTMCWNSDLKADVVRLGGVQVIMKALDDHYTSSGLVKNACRALAQVAFNCERYRDEMSAKGVIPLIIRGMEQHPSYDRAQMHGCVALSYLSWTNEGNAAQITANRGYKVVVDAMRNHTNNHEVQEHACRALANISNVSLEDSAAALEQIVAAMRRHEHVNEVQEEACRAIVTLSLISPANKDCLFELKGAEAVVTAMRNFPHIQLVQQEACNALAHLAYEHANLNSAVTELGGVALLLTAMRTHQRSPKVQLNACGGLCALAFDNTVAQQQIFDLGGVKCVIHAMDNFERLRMLELGCSVLGTLAWNTDIKERVAVEAIPEILKAMRIHESSPLLQKSTCRAISQFAFNSESNRQLLAESGAIPLIVNAMRSHLTTEKLIVHAVKALTYLCWENSQVAETIINEHVEEVLQCIVEHYAHTQRVYSEAVHLSKILFRKTTGSPSPNQRLMSPPVASPQPISQTPGPSLHCHDDLAPPTPPQRERDEHHFYQMPVDGPQQYAYVDPQSNGGGELNGRGLGRGRGGRGGRGAPRGGGRGGGGSGGDRGRGRGRGVLRGRGGPVPAAGVPPSSGGVVSAFDDAVDARFARHVNYADHRSGGEGGRRRNGDSEDLWDDPDPGTYHGNRQRGQMNWQQQQQQQLSDEAPLHHSEPATNEGGNASEDHRGGGGARRYGAYRGGRGGGGRRGGGGVPRQ